MCFPYTAWRFCLALHARLELVKAVFKKSCNVYASSGREEEWTERRGALWILNAENRELERSKKKFYLEHVVPKRFLEREKRNTEKKKPHQGEQGNHNHCRNVEDLSHLITEQQRECTLSFSLLSWFQVSVCHLSNSHSRKTFFTFSCVIPLVVTTSLRASIRQQLVLSKTISRVFVPSFTCTNLQQERAPCLPFPSLSLHPSILPLLVRLSLRQQVMAVRLDGCSNFPESLSSRTMMRLYFGWCVWLLVCVTVGVRSFFISYQRAVWDAKERSLCVCTSLFQPASGRVSLPCCCCCCCFDAFQAHSNSECSNYSAGWRN